MTTFDFQNQSSVRLENLAKAAIYYEAILKGGKGHLLDLTPFKVELDGLNSVQLLQLANAAAERAFFLKTQEPPYPIALMKGIKDNSSYSLQRGYVYSYSGEAKIRLENGQEWHAIGRACRGDAYYAVDGYIEFIPINV